MPFAEKHGKAKADGTDATVAEAHGRKPTWATHRADFLGASPTAFRWAERARIIDKVAVGGAETPAQGVQRGGSRHRAGGP